MYYKYQLCKHDRKRPAPCSCLIAHNTEHTMSAYEYPRTSTKHLYYSGVLHIDTYFEYFHVDRNLKMCVRVAAPYYCRNY